MEENVKYEQAVSELETIVRKMENDQLDIDTLAERARVFSDRVEYDDEVLDACIGGGAIPALD